LSGPNGEQLAEISRELRSMHKPALHGWITSLHSCPGEDCKYAIRSTREICDRIERIHLPRPLPAKMKIGLAGCLRCCTSPYVRDLGLIAEPKGWKLIFGGNAGGRPRIGDCVAKGLNDDQTIELIHRCIMVYLDKAAPKMRTARFMELYDAEKFKKNVLDTPLCNQPVEG
jgi:NAD(P)H-nitrite reductase large subunit